MMMTMYIGKEKKYPRKGMKEGFPKLEWEAEAYRRQTKK